MADYLRLAARGVLRFLHERRMRTWPDDRLAASALVVAPHQDDETLGCGGTIARKRAAGAEVNIVFTTDGSTSHRRLMSAEEMAPLRRSEALAAAAVLGVPAENVHFLGHPNRELILRTDVAAAEIAELLERLQPAEVFTPWRDDPPSDHKATYEATVAALAIAGRRVTLHEYPVWLWQQWPWCRPEFYQPDSRGDWWRAQADAGRALLDGFHTSVDVRGVIDHKRAALDEHASQTSRRDGNPDWSVLADVADGEFLDRLFGPYEVFRTTETGEVNR